MQDFVVVGAGVSGLTSALLLAHHGYSVALVEKSAHTAPLLRGFSRRGVQFDTGFHYTGGIGKGETLDVFFRCLGLSDRLSCFPFDARGFDTFRNVRDGFEFRFPSGYGPLRENLLKAFPSERSAVETYLGAVRSACDSIPYLNLDAPLDTKGALARVFGPTLKETLDSLTGDEILKSVLSIHCLLYGVPPFVRFRKEDLETIPLPSILVVNHLSFVDGYYMASLPFHDLTFAVGAWPFKMYWYAAFMRLARYIDVENVAWDDAVTICRRAASKNGCVLFFPEGHRSRDRRLLPFYSGAFRMAIETGLPLVPLCITGTDILLPPGEHWLHPADVRLRALPAVDPAGFEGTSAPTRLSNFVWERMATALEEMRGTPGGSRKDGTDP